MRHHIGKGVWSCRHDIYFEAVQRSAQYTAILQNVALSLDAGYTTKVQVSEIKSNNYTHCQSLLWE